MMLRLWGFDGGWVWERGGGGVLFLLISREGLRFFFTCLGWGMWVGMAFTVHGGLLWVVGSMDDI